MVIHTLPRLHDFLENWRQWWQPVKHHQQMFPNFKAVGFLTLTFRILVPPFVCGNESRFFPIWNLRKVTRMPFRGSVIFYSKLRIYKTFSFPSEKSFPKPFQGSGWKSLLAQKMILLLKWPWFSDRAINTGFLLSKTCTFPWARSMDSDLTTSMLPWKVWEFKMLVREIPTQGISCSSWTKSLASWAWGRSVFSSFPGTKVCIPSWYTAPCPKGIEKGHHQRKLWASLVAQLVKNPPAMRETGVRSLDWEDPPLEKGKATHSSIPA